MAPKAIRLCGALGRLEQSSRRGLGLGARRSSGPGEAGLRTKPRPLPPLQRAAANGLPQRLLSSSLAAGDHEPGAAHAAALS